MKKVLLLFLIVVMCLECVACGDDNSTENSFSDYFGSNDGYVSEVDEEKEERKLMAEEAADITIEELKSKLKSPHSLIILEDVAVYAANSLDIVYVKIEYSSENYFGAAVEESVEAIVNIKTDGTQGFLISSAYDSEKDMMDLLNEQQIMKGIIELQAAEDYDIIILDKNSYND